jgi:N-acetylmuramoyl-L-alanine amidase
MSGVTHTQSARTFRSVRAIAYVSFFFLVAPSPLFAEDPGGGNRTAGLHCRDDFRVFIDIGHSKRAPGAVSARGITEFYFNTRLAETLRTALVKKGYHKIEVFISKGGPRSLEERVQISNKFRADVFISIHHDDVQDRYKSFWPYNGTKHAFSDMFKGYSLFISKLSPTWPRSLQFAKLISDAFLERGMTFTKHHAEQIEGEGRTLLDDNRGIYQYDELIVLKNATSPAVLIEAGVIVNRDEEIILGTPARRELFSEAVAQAVQEFCLAQATEHQ